MKKSPSYIFFILPYSFLRGRANIHRSEFCVCWGFMRMPSPWRLARKIHSTHHKVVIMAKIYCRDMVRIYNGRISVEKHIDRVWRNSRTAFLRCSPSYEGLRRAPLLFAVKMQQYVCDAPALRSSRSLLAVSHIGTLCPTHTRRKVALFAPTV